MKTHKVSFLNQLCTVHKGKYASGGVTLQLTCEDGEPMTTATVNIPGSCNEGELLIKNYSENEGLLEVLEKAGIVKDTGKRVASGWVEIPVCELLI